MALHLDQKMLTGFVREAQEYLPQLRDSLTAFRQEPTHREALDEAFRYVHTIQGAAAMVGLPTLSHVASYVASMLHEVIRGERQLDVACNTWMFRTTDHIHQYLEGLLAGDMRQQALVTEMVEGFRRVKQLPQSGDMAAIAAVMDEEMDLISMPVRANAGLAIAPDEAADVDDAVDTEVEDEDFPVEVLSASVASGSETLETVGEAAPAQAPDTLQTLLMQIDADVQRAYSHHTMPGSPAGTLTLSHQTDRYILFTLGGSRYVVPVAHVLEIGRIPRITPVPNVPVWVRGVMNLRGDILSVIDFRLFLGLEVSQPAEHSRMLVVKAPGDEMTTSLIIDHILGIIPLTSARLALPETMAQHKSSQYLAGAYEYENQVCAVFDLERLLSSPEVRQFE